MRDKSKSSKYFKNLRKLKTNALALLTEHKERQSAVFRKAFTLVLLKPLDHKAFITPTTRIRPSFWFLKTQLLKRVLVLTRTSKPIVMVRTTI